MATETVGMAHHDAVASLDQVGDRARALHVVARRTGTHRLRSAARLDLWRRALAPVRSPDLPVDALVAPALDGRPGLLRPEATSSWSLSAPTEGSP